MFETPIDAWYVWIGLAVASVAVAGIVGALPRTAPPDAAAAADAIDRVAAGEHAATAEHRIDAAAVRLGSRRIALRNDGGTARAAVAFGPVTPAPEGSPLERVARGEPPDRVFDSGRTFEEAVLEARTRAATWRPAGDKLVIRAIVRGDRRVTLVAA